MEKAAGNDAEAAKETQLATSMAASVHTNYALPDGCFAAYIDRASGTLSAPFETPC